MTRFSAVSRVTCNGVKQEAFCDFTLIYRAESEVDGQWRLGVTTRKIMAGTASATTIRI